MSTDSLLVKYVVTSDKKLGAEEGENRKCSRKMGLLQLEETSR